MRKEGTKFHYPTEHLPLITDDPTDDRWDLLRDKILRDQNEKRKQAESDNLEFNE